MLCENSGLILIQNQRQEEKSMNSTQKNQGDCKEGVCRTNGSLQVCKVWDCLVQDGWQPVHWASQEGHLDCLEFLMKNGADISAVNKVSTSKKRSIVQWRDRVENDV